MSSNEIRVLGDLELSGALSFGKNFNDFPVDPKPRTIIIKQGQAYMYTELVNGSGYFTWQPIGVKQTSYLHTQGVASTTWTVTHDFNSNDFAYFVYDNNHRLVVANIELVNPNTARILLSEAMTGTAVFFSVQYVSAPAINAAESITVKTLTLRDASGVLTVNNNIIAMEESVAARFALVYTATQANTAIATAVSAEAVLRAAADEALGARIDAVLSNIDAGALDSLTELLAAFQGADSNLNSAITALGASSTSALAAEVTARTAAVTGAIATASADATAKVLAEANIRSANDATVLTQAEGYADTKVSAEATARATAVTGAIATAASDATSKVAVETAARISADAATLASANAAMATAVNAEATARSSADTANLATAHSYADSAVSAEAALRISNDALTVTAANTYADSQLALEVIARTSSDAATLATGKTYADGIVSTEATARVAAVDAEATTRAAADATTLANAKTYADSQITATLSTLSSSVTSASSGANDYTDTKIATEVQARLAGDATNATAISAEATARATADTAAIATAAMDATTKVAAEATIRATAVTAASTSATNAINAEAGRAQTAEAALSSAVNTEATARAAGDTSTLATAKTYTDGAIRPAVKAYLTEFDGDIVPSKTLTYNLGSPTKQFHSVYVGPGTLYVNGKPVIQDNSDTITFSTDPDQNLRIETKGNGHLQLQTGIGTIDVNSTLAMQSGKRITDSAGIQVELGNALQMNSNKIMGVGTPTLPTDATNKSFVDSVTTGDTTIVRTTAAQNINGVKTFVDGIVVQGDFTVTGTTTTINSVTLKIADNLIDLNSDFTAGTATENAGIRVMRGDEPATQLRWNESGNKWELTNDGATYSGITTASDLAAKSTSLTGDVAGIGAGSISTVLSVTGVTAGTYGTAGSTGVFTVDAKGRISSAATTAISITNSQVSDFATGVRALHSAGTGITYSAVTGAIGIDTTIATKVYADASSTTALTTAKTYADGIVATEVTARNTAIAAGNATTLASGKTYADGIVATEATARNTAIAAGDATTLASAQTFANTATAATLVTAKSYADTGDAATLVTAKAYTDTVAATASGATAGTYGNAATVPTIVVNAQGKITSVSANTISVTSSSISDFTEAAQDVIGIVLVNSTHTGISAAYDDAGSKINLSLAASGVTASTYGGATSAPTITVAADGRITSAVSTAIAFPVTSVAGKTGAVTLAVTDVTNAASTTYVDTGVAGAKTYADGIVATEVTARNTAISSAIATEVTARNTAISSAVATETTARNTAITSVVAGNVASATKLATARSIAATGDATWSVSFDGSAPVSAALTLANSGVTPGSYNNVTVDAKGRVTAGSTVAYLTGYTETDTLATVTARGASTSTAVTFNGGLTTTSVSVDGFGTIDTATLTTSAVTASQVLDSNSATAVRSVKYIIQATSGAAYQSVEMLVIHDGTNVSMVEYANVATGADLADFDADISGGNVRLLVTPANAATVFKVMKTTVGV